MPDIDVLDLGVLDTSGMDSHLLDVIRSAPLPGLKDSPHCSRTSRAIQEFIQEMSELQPGLVAGLWLLAGDLERSHAISQSMPSAEGSLWHAIMHRSEGDYWNSKYWYRKAKGHPVLTCLADRMGQQIRQTTEFQFVSSQLEKWTMPSQVAETLVDHVELSVRKHQDWQPSLQRVCWWEWQLLFQHCLSKP